MGYVKDQVIAYLEDCERNPQLNRKYHPTPEGALKMVPHHTKAEAAEITAAYTAALRRTS